eukprot:1649507-Karenia_brevis.AAC.1
MMLPKYTLCAPTRAGKGHEQQRLAFTRSRLQRWIDGERLSLWIDRPNYNSNKRRNRLDTKSEAAKEALLQQRCIDMC